MIIHVYKVRPKAHPFPILAWLIMMFQNYMPWNKKAWSHMALSIGDGFVIDASGKGVLKSTEAVFFDEYTLVDMVMIDIDATISEYKAWEQQHTGKKYDVLGIIGLLLKALGFVTFNKIGHNYKRLICSELILNLIDTFKDVYVGDSDNYDLNMTWDLVYDFHQNRK